MRPVNLLPEKQRPVERTGGRSGSAYVVLGALGLVLIAVVAYALTINQINSRESETIHAEQETAEAEARAAELSPFGDFRTIKETRVTAVSTLAQARLDYERLSRELSRVLPARAWLSEMEASTSGEDADSSVGEDSGSGPSVTVSGCAKSQPVVARLLVRLRRVNRAEQVELAESSKSDTAGGTSSGSSIAESSGDCGRFYSFDASVRLAPPTPGGEPAAADENVPAALGGGG